MVKRYLTSLIAFILCFSICTVVASAVKVIEFEEIVCFEDDNFVVVWDDYEDEYILRKYKGNDTKVTIPATIEGYHIDIIANDLFQFNDKVQEIVISNGIKHIEGRAFNGCSNLKKVVIPASVTDIGEDFCAYTAIELEDIGDLYYRSTWLCRVEPWKDPTVVKVREGTTALLSMAFANEHSLKSISIPDSVTSIGTMAFVHCDALTEIKLPHNLSCIERYTFNMCDNLKTVYIPKSVTSIKEYAFGLCNSLTDIYYEGSEEDWNKIDIDYRKGFWDTDGTNKILYDVNIHYNSTKPYENSQEIKNVAKIQGLKAYTTTNKVRLKWNDDDATGYIVEYNKNGKWVRLTKTVKNTCTIKGLKAGTKYKFRIKAYLKDDGQVLYGKYKTFSVTTKRK